MATVTVGSLNELSVCRIETDPAIDGIDHPKYVEFEVPSATSPIKPGEPKWANYVKGVVASFHGTKIDLINKHFWSLLFYTTIFSHRTC